MLQTTVFSSVITDVDQNAWRRTDLSSEMESVAVVRADFPEACR
jgi:hypothetical protein